jgi:predicted acylesterase/phospholipase RssA
MYKILSFCGGGIRGLFSAILLKRVQAEVPDLIAQANMVAGTSTGANICAYLLAGLDPERIVLNYYESVPFWADQRTIATEPAYQHGPVVKSFEKHFEKAYGKSNPSLLDLARLQGKDTVITAFDVGGQGVPWSPVLFSNLGQVDYEGVATNNGGTGIVDATVASGSMPGMFGTYENMIDGAFVNHDPTLAAISLAIQNGHDPSDIVVMCFGTGFMANWIGSEGNARWGAQQWEQGVKAPGNRLPSLLINGSTPASPVLNAILNGTSTNLMPDMARMMLPPSPDVKSARYAYLNANFGDTIIPENGWHLKQLEFLETAAKDVDIRAAVSMAEDYWNK